MPRKTPADGPVFIAPRRPHLAPGKCEMNCESAVIENRFGRKVAKLTFQNPLDPEHRVDCYMNLCCGLNSTYYAAWLCANGSPPRERQVMSVRVFPGKFFEVELGETTREYDGTKLTAGQGYTVVRRILRRTL